MSSIASRIAARSTTAGTPVKSCISTRAGWNGISTDGSALASQVAIASTSSGWTDSPSSSRSAFSSRIFSEYGSRATSNFDCRASRRWISYSVPETSSTERASKLFPLINEQYDRPARAANYLTSSFRLTVTLPSCSLVVTLTLTRSLPW